MDGFNLTGRRILLVEDEYLVAKSLARLLDQWGAQIVGPVATVEKAMAILQAPDPPDAALVDINLRGVMAFQVADAAIARGVLLVLTTGYDTAVIPERYRQVAILQKPCDPAEISRALMTLAM
jgi:DNA-binding NtrC family response regulator